jgi:circadian clock protein KaiC
VGDSESAVGRDRCLTGIDGLDNILSGGLPRNNTILVTGSCGTGKTSMSLEFLLHGAENGEKGLLVAATEPVDKLMENMIPYDFYDAKLLEQKDIVFLDLHDLYRKAKTEGPEIDQKGSEALVKAIMAAVKSHGAKRLVIDSITSICARLLTADLIREFIRSLSQLVAQEECTALLVAEVPAGDERYSPYGVEEAVVDGVILLGNLERQGDLLRTLQVVKMRGTTHSRAKYILDLTSVGVLLAPLLKGGP